MLINPACPVACRPLPAWCAAGPLALFASLALALGFAGLAQRRRSPTSLLAELQLRC